MPKDVNQIAFHNVELTTQEPQEQKVSRSLISRIMSQMGKKGGKVSGKRRMTNISPERRREIALKAAQARWNKATPTP
ncbi:MAG TPA: hypothetical protein VHF01_17470 [Candidatus Acidoferrum sp.]|nr:hypothetical protein [Candidatus Acidoferrum sp.]